MNKAVKTLGVQDKQYGACCRWGIWIQVMTSCRIHMAEGDITLHCVAVSGRLFWLVQRIINPARHLQLQIYYTSDLFQKSEWLASPVSVISYQREFMSQPPNAQAALFLGRGSVGLSVKTFSNLIRAGRAASMRAKWRARFCHSANQRYEWRWCKTRRGSVFSWSVHLSTLFMRAQTDSRKWRNHNHLSQPLSSNSSPCSITVYVNWKMPQLMFMTD